MSCEIKASLDRWKRALRSDKKPERFRTEIFVKLKRMEEEILRLRGKERGEVMETYREFLLLLKDEPIFLMRS